MIPYCLVWRPRIAMSLAYENSIDITALLHPAGLYTGWRIFGQVVIPGALRNTDFDMMTVHHWCNNGLSPLSTIGSEPVQWGIPDTHIMQSKQQYTRVYNIKCTRQIKQGGDCSPMYVNCHKDIVMYFEQKWFGAVVLFICTLQNIMETILNKVLVNLSTTIRSMILH